MLPVSQQGSTALGLSKVSPFGTTWRAGGTQVLGQAGSD